jgi:nucleolar MIF4G domain-containing protein 1
VQKKAKWSGPSLLKRPKLQHTKYVDAKNYSFDAGDHHPDASPPKEPILKEIPKPKSILKTAKLPKEPDKGVPHALPSPQPLEKLPGHIAAKLAQDDAEIAALEKKLGIKSKKKLPQAFKVDGLDELLEGLGGYSGASIQSSNTDHAARDWLAQKRSQTNHVGNGRKGSKEEEDFSSEDDHVISEISAAEDAFQGDEENGLAEVSEDDTAVDFEDDFEGFDSGSDKNSLSPPQTRMKENPYVAPNSQGNQTSLKYVPPSLRKPFSDSEVLVRVRRQAQGLINRLTEANLISILGEVEKLYRENARQHVTSTLVDLLLISVCEPTALPDTLIILPAGFITAIYKVIGTDFGAQVIERVVELFDEHYDQASKAGNSGHTTPAPESSKETSNLITLLADLYNFQVVGSNLIFDYIRLFLQTLSELNAELLLRIIRVSGPQLRQDDPSSLRDIIAVLRPAVSDVGERNLSVRTKFMIESINDLKNNRLKTGTAASSVISEHIVRMKKTIGTLNTRGIKASEPLRIGLRDIQESDKRGKWWLVGSSWAGNTSTKEKIESGTELIPNAQIHDSMGSENGTSDLVQLAREQRMNTDIRKAIFVTLMSASDYEDAYRRLLKLKLKKVQRLEIPKVIIHCSSAEKHYNPYYTLIAKKLCGDRKLSMAFQFSLWDLFKRLGEANENGNVLEDNDDEEILDIRQLVNHAKMFGVLIVEDGISLSVLKNLNLRYLQLKTKMFVEVLLVTVLLHTQLQSQNRRDEQALMRVFSKVKNTPSMIRGLQYFLKRVVAKTDIAGGEAEAATVRWACKVAASILDSILIAENAKA